MAGGGMALSARPRGCASGARNATLIRTASPQRWRGVFQGACYGPAPQQASAERPASQQPLCRISGAWRLGAAAWPRPTRVPPNLRRWSSTPWPCTFCCVLPVFFPVRTKGVLAVSAARVLRACPSSRLHVLGRPPLARVCKSEATRQVAHRLTMVDGEGSSPRTRLHRAVIATAPVIHGRLRQR